MHALGLETLTEEERGPARRRSGWLAEREEARAAKDFERADALRDRLAEIGWEVRDTPTGRSSCAGLDRLRAQSGAGGPARWARRSPRVVRGGRGRRGRTLERLCGSPDHQGICAEVEPFPYSDADELLSADDALVVCLDEVQDPHNLGAVCRVAEAAGAAGVVIPERARRR